jgi:hypothetical protein
MKYSSLSSNGISGIELAMIIAHLAKGHDDIG